MELCAVKASPVLLFPASLFQRRRRCFNSSWLSSKRPVWSHPVQLFWQSGCCNEYFRCSFLHIWLVKKKKRCSFWVWNVIFNHPRAFYFSNPNKFLVLLFFGGCFLVQPTMINTLYHNLCIGFFVFIQRCSGHPGPSWRDPSTADELLMNRWRVFCTVW